MEKNFLREYKGYKIFEQQSEEGSDVNIKRITVEGTSISFVFDFTDPSIVNKAIEAAKAQIKNLPPAWKSSTKEVAKEIYEDMAGKPVNSLRKCRVCGCTEDNCAQCIEKTGKPCHWVEQDLCSACVREPEIKITDSRAAQSLDENIPAPAGDSFFFQQLATMGNVDMTLRIMKVNGSFTIGITPGNKVKGLKPVNITGTPEEFDKEFVTVIMPKLKTIPGLVSNIESVKKDAEGKPKDKPVTSAKKEKTKQVKKKAEPKKSPPAKKPSKKQPEKVKTKPVKVKKEKTIEKPAAEVVPAVVEQALF